MQRPVVRTYARNVAKTTEATKAFDDLVGNASGPSIAMASTTMQKWGNTKFTSSRAVPDAVVDSRKRKTADSPCSFDDDDGGFGDPFSFDSDDEGPSNPSRGMGFKVKKAAGRASNSQVSTGSSSSGFSSHGSKPASKYSRKDNGAKGYSNKNTIDNFSQSSTSSISSSSSGTRQVSMDSFTCKQSTNGTSTTVAKLKISKTKPVVKKVVKKFFTSKQQDEDHTYSSPRSSTKSSPPDHTYSHTHVCSESDAETYDSDWDMESGDPEIIFNSPKKKKEAAKREASIDAVRKSSFIKELVCNAEDTPYSDAITVSSDLTEAIDNDTDSVSSEHTSASSVVSFSQGDRTIRAGTIVGLTESGSDCESVTSSQGGSINSQSELARTTSAPLLGSKSASNYSTKLKKIGSLDETKKTSSKPLVRRLLTSPKKKPEGKAVYNPRQWQGDSEEKKDDAVKSSSQATTSSVYDDFDDEPSSCPDKDPVFKRSIRTSKGYGRESITAVKITKQHKPLYTVVRNVKQAHECLEYGETQDFQDEVDYILTGLGSQQSSSIRCLSTISLATKSIAPAFRMHLRAHGTITTIFNSLHDAPKHKCLSLCTAAVMYMLSRDRLNMDLEKSSLELMVGLLSADPEHESNTADKEEFQRTRAKICGICEKLRMKKEGTTIKQLTMEDISTGNLAMETLLSLTSKRAGDWFKEALRTLGGLDHIIDTVSDCVEELDEFVVDPTETMLDKLTKIDRCLRVVENVTYLNSDNQKYLIRYKSSKLIDSLCRTLAVCENCLSFNEVETTADGKVNKECPGYVVFCCLLAILRVLLNLTHDNDYGGTRVGQQEGLVCCLLSCVLRIPQYVPNEERFDLLVLGLGLLINMVEHSDCNRRLLLETSTYMPYNAGVNRNRKAEALEALTELFKTRLEAARLMEREHDAALEKREQDKLHRLQKSDKLRERLNAKTTSEDLFGEDENLADQSGVWHESESGLEWVVMSPDNDQKKKKNDGHTSDTSSLASSDGVDALPGSQAENENFTNALHKAGRHMEDSIIAAYTALVVGCTIQGNEDLGEQVKDLLPECSFEPMIRMLKKFLGFMNFTNENTTGSKSIMQIIEVLDCF